MRGRRALDDRGLGRVLLRLIAATDAAGGVSFGLAFAAGLLSFLSPCVLPLIPSYVGFLTGLSLEELQARRGTALLHALWFVAGFSLIFLALGATASALGRLLLQYQLWIGRVGGVHPPKPQLVDRKSTRLNSSHSQISYAVFCLKKKKKTHK